MKRPTYNNQTNPSQQLICYLKKWSGRNEFIILFDTDIDGNGVGTLENAIYNKENLYFIHFDSDNNIYGGFVTSQITRKDFFIKDSNAFVFSLMKRKCLTLNKFTIINDSSKYAFTLYHDNNLLYQFGYFPADIVVCGIGNKHSYCSSNSYNYNGIKDSMVKSHPFKFKIQRIIVVQMN
ncbi:TLDc domain-containing protein [Entamoeba marina]